LNDETFVRQVHRALHHLYDPVELRLSPLAASLGITRGDVPAALRKILLDGIAALRPGPRVPLESNTWRVYQVLCYRFEEQSAQEDVAAQMAISPRQVRRLEYTAIRALASQLASQFALSLPAGEELGDKELLEEAQDEVVLADQAGELKWLRKSYSPESADLYHLVETTLKTGESMLAMSGGAVRVDLPPGLPPALGQATTLRQILLNLILAGLETCPQANLQVSAGVQDEMVWIELAMAGSPQTASSALAQDSEYLTLARHLASLSGGVVDLLASGGAQPFCVRLSMHIANPPAVLFVDDNQDSLRLFELSLVGTRYAFVSTRDPNQALTLAEEYRVRAIILDIMLPDVDGWELLGRIRAHPQLGGIPVVISTILPHEQLALSLGAAAFLRKPVGREVLLETLDRLVGNRTA
jgi:CheY-like chemotaxis protein